MELNQYQELAQRTCNMTERPIAKIENGILGMCGESGECADLLKKYLHQGHELNPDKLAEEIGDVLWYVAEAAAGLGLSLEQIAQRNIDKLKKRYPAGFDPERSIHRPEYERKEQAESASNHLFSMRNKTL